MVSVAFLGSVVCFAVCFVLRVVVGCVLLILSGLGGRFLRTP